MVNKINRQVHTIDATGQVAGRLATQVATILRGKNKPEFLPNVDGGDSVKVVNIKELRFTGAKLAKKVYKHYSGYQGGLKQEKLSVVFNQRPAEVLWRAVWNMLPKNKLRAKMIKRLKIV